MKSLTLLRHAKTERQSGSGRDFDRRLNDRGRLDAAHLGQEIRKLGLVYDLIICSPAARAAETAELAGLSPLFDERIYDASTGRLLDIAQEQGDGTERVLMIGHNPGFEQLASLLTGASVDMPTGSLIEIALPTDRWQNLGAAEGRVVRFLKPKMMD